MQISGKTEQKCEKIKKIDQLFEENQPLQQEDIGEVNSKRRDLILLVSYHHSNVAHAAVSYFSICTRFNSFNRGKNALV